MYEDHDDGPRAFADLSSSVAGHTNRECRCNGAGIRGAQLRVSISSGDDAAPLTKARSGRIASLDVIVVIAFSMATNSNFINHLNIMFTVFILLCTHSDSLLDL